MNKEKIINDLSIQIATVNGSGSQSSNSIILKSLFRMGIPVGGKNIFASNIAGLPTWYTIRANKNGYVALKKEIDLVIAMNQDTIKDDIASVIPGGILIFNSDLQIESTEKRTDITWYEVPFNTLAKDNFSEVKLRKLLTNMLYVGFVSSLLGLEEKVVKGVITDNFEGKEKAVAINCIAFDIGFNYFKENFSKQDNYYIERMDENQGKIMIDGNTSGALGSLFAGCTVVAWYPITPATGLCETLISYFKKYRIDKNGKANFAEVQAEDELAAIGMLIGAGWAGARALTATSGPGISLMSEFSGLGYYAEIPAVIWNVQRMGPSTGLPTRTSQGDLLSTYMLSHGDTKHIVLLPSSVEDCFSMASDAFDLAERFQTPVFVLSDLDFGMNNWMANEFVPSKKIYDRGKVLNAEELEKIGKFERYRDVDGDGIPYRTLPGTKHKLAGYFTRGTGHNEKAGYSEKSDDYMNNMERLNRKYETAKKYVPQPLINKNKSVKTGIIAFGSTDQAMDEARSLLKKKGISTNYLLLKSLPLCDEVEEFIKENEIVYVIEQNRDAQLLRILSMEYRKLAGKLEPVLHFSGMPVDALSIVNIILEKERVAV